MQDVTAWLQGLGLAKYAEAFLENEIDWEALPHLSDAMLEQIGMPIGPRAKLRVAIVKLNEFASDGSSSNILEPQREAERRQITVLFSDLVDSTSLASRLDAEDLRSVMQTYQRICAKAIEGHDGHIAQYLGDGIMAYFGWPSAREDAAEQAVRAGLDVVEAVKATAGPETLSVRVGISTGVVVISETGLGDPSIPAGAIGETPHIAARLQAVAAANSVVISETTSRLIGNRFDLDEMGPQYLKGVVEPVSVFRVRRIREGANRFQAAHAAALTPLVGRSAELAVLQQRWHDARDGEGQVVFVSGVPGIGKSRIVYELQESIKGEPKFTLEYQCLPLHMHSPLFPIIQHFERLAKFSTDDSNHEKLDKIEKILGVGSKQIHKVAPVLAEMLSIPGESRYAPLGLTAQQIKSQTLSLLVEHILDLAATGPVFCLLEDAQWVDPSTQELLDLLVRKIGIAQVLVVVTHRPEYQVQAGVHGNMSAMTLSRLSRRDADAMAQLALRDRIVSSEAMARIVEESDYIPLFVEELAHGTIETAGVNEQSGQDRYAELPTSLSVPDSLRDSLVARLDRVPQARRVAQMAAVVGRDFSYELLHQISPLGDSELISSLAHLKQSEIIQQLDNEKSGRYMFKHALVRDAAYESILKSRLKEIHARVGAALEKYWKDIVSNQPELLAYHYSQAGNDEMAVRYWLLGGQRAHGRSANVEAINQLQRALEFLHRLPETSERSATELEIQLSLGPCLVAVRGYAADETCRSYERARELGAQLADRDKELQAMFGLWGHYWMRAEHDRAVDLGETMLAMAEETGDRISLLVGHRSLGSTLFTLGEFVRAQEHLERTISLAQQIGSEKLTLSYVVDPRIAAQLLHAWNCWILGYPSRALEIVMQALELANAHRDPYGIAFAQYVTSVVLLLRGDAQESLDHADQSLALSREHRISLYGLYARFGRGCALAQMGRVPQGMVEIQEGVEEAKQSNVCYMRAFMDGWLATVQSANGDPEAALALIDETLGNMDDVTGRAWEVEVRRLRGDFLLAARVDAASDAERSYVDAIAVAQRQHARSLELRATTSLARLLRDQGRVDEARGFLAPIYGWFTEGMETADLKAAGALLAELG